MHEKLQKIEQIKNPIMECVKSQVCGDMYKCDTAELGAAIDMLKDLSEMEKNCIESEYHKTIMEAMREDEPMGYSGSSFNRTMRPSYGYNDRRYADGRYAPKGRGVRYGYPGTQTMVDDDAYMVDAMHDTRHGRAYNEYRDAKRYYTETKSPEAKNKMKEKSEEYMEDTMESIRDIWYDADEEMKHKLKESMEHLMQEMD